VVGLAEPVLSVRELSYRYPTGARDALERISLEVETGEFVLLAGGSGSGKTTLLRAACGLVPHFHGGEFGGEVTVRGRSTRGVGPAELALEVGFLAQEPEAQVVSTTVRAELELPLELRGRGAADRARAVEEVALALGIEPLLDRTTATLSGGELQRVAIGAALVTRPPLLLLDEPTSQLDPVGTDELIALLRRLNEEWGVAVVLGEQRIERCLAAADRVIALRDAGLAYDGPRSGFGAAAIARCPELAPPVTRIFAAAGRAERPTTVKDARRALAATPAPLPAGDPITNDERAPAAPSAPAATMLRARRLHVALGRGEQEDDVVHGVGFEVGRGERVALMGPNGAGKSTLLRAAAGLLPARRGSVETPAGCALLSQRPDDLLLAERVGDELPGEAGALALRSVGLDVDPEADPRDLSGGERQRLALAIAMAGRGAGGEPPGLICLDEPTRGLDRDRKDALAGWLGELAERGAAAVVATHDVEFAAGWAERVILLARGRVLAEGPLAEVLAGGWYFATDAARVTDGRAVGTTEAAALLSAGERAGVEGRSR
jgi:energy-coupling factor transport system ATP-binding protein